MRVKPDVRRGAIPTSVRVPGPWSGAAGVHSVDDVSSPALATLWIFRVLTLPQAILFVLQPISIGSFLQGSWAAFGLHSIAGGILVLPTMATAAVGLLLAVLARRPWVGIGSVALGVLTTGQVAMGHTRLLAVHIPLGVLLVTLAVCLAIWPWTKGARR